MPFLVFFSFSCLFGKVWGDVSCMQYIAYHMIEVGEAIILKTIAIFVVLEYSKRFLGVSVKFNFCRGVRGVYF